MGKSKGLLSFLLCLIFLCGCQATANNPDADSSVKASVSVLSDISSKEEAAFSSSLSSLESGSDTHQTEVETSSETVTVDESLPQTDSSVSSDTNSKKSQKKSQSKSLNTHKHSSSSTASSVSSSSKSSASSSSKENTDQSDTTITVTLCLQYAIEDSHVIHSIVPNGRIYSVELPEGATVFDALKAVCDAQEIPLVYQGSVKRKTVYVQGIGQLFEKDAGNQSGWKYKVNEQTVNTGASACLVQDQDEILWYYSMSVFA